MLSLNGIRGKIAGKSREDIKNMSKDEISKDPVAMCDFEEALSNVQPSVSTADIERHEKKCQRKAVLNDLRRMNGLSLQQILSEDPFHGLVCELLYCGEGKCKESNTSIFGADCECYPGWKKIQFGALIFPSCLIPNSCNFVWCGDGNCRKNGNTYACECNAGSQNLLNSSRSACFKPCYLGADCSGPDIVFQGSSPPPLISPAPPPRRIHRSLYHGHFTASFDHCLVVKANKMAVPLHKAY